MQIYFSNFYALGMIGVTIGLLCVTIILCYSSEKRKHLMTEMQEKDLMLANLLANIPGGVAIYKVDGDTISTIYSSEGVPKLTGRTMGEYQEWIRGGLFTNVVYQEDCQAVHEAIQKYTPDGKPVNIRFRVQHKDGALIWLALSAVFIRMEGSARVYYTVLSDVSIQVRSEQKDMEARRAKEANQAKTEFLATVSHYMRTPLNGILGLTHLMLGRAEDEEQKKDLLRLENSG